MRDRIKLIMKRVNLSQAHFADAIGVQRATVNHILNGRNNPSLDIVTKIYSTFPSVDLKWLITGEGNENFIDKREIDIPDVPDKTKKIVTDLFNKENNLLQSHSRKEDKKTDYNEVKRVDSRDNNESFIEEKNVPVTKDIKEIIVFFSDGSYQKF
ncbi:MAG TPA: helix-turn-helix transcriptional regulator [Bacteroidaceae bacterium]|nr:helix-turn-helix transcriptional regulator [Bacteroidaceae bacterium]